MPTLCSDEESRPNTPVNVLVRFETLRGGFGWSDEQAYDHTCVPTVERWLYLAAIVDLFGRRFVGWAMGERMTADLTLRVLKMALQRRQPFPGLVHHSDQGSQYIDSRNQALLAQVGIEPSMNGAGTWCDNAPLESFFGMLKTERVYHVAYRSRDEARTDLSYCIQVWYNRNWPHSSLAHVSPEAFEQSHGHLPEKGLTCCPRKQGDATDLQRCFLAGRYTVSKLSGHSELELGIRPSAREGLVALVAVGVMLVVAGEVGTTGPSRLAMRDTALALFVCAVCAWLVYDLHRQASAWFIVLSLSLAITTVSWSVGSPEILVLGCFPVGLGAMLTSLKGAAVKMMKPSTHGMMNSQPAMFSFCSRPRLLGHVGFAMRIGSPLD